MPWSWNSSRESFHPTFQLVAQLQYAWLVISLIRLPILCLIATLSSTKKRSALLPATLTHWPGPLLHSHPAWLYSLLHGHPSYTWQWGILALPSSVASLVHMISRSSSSSRLPRSRSHTSISFTICLWYIRWNNTFWTCPPEILRAEPADYSVGFCNCWKSLPSSSSIITFYH